MALRNCKHKGLKELFCDGHSTKIGARYSKRAGLILDVLQAMQNIEDCKGTKDFHELKGSRRGTYSMHVSGNYCITFKWDGHDVYDVNFEDYH